MSSIKCVNLTAEQAAERILGFYDSIPAMSPQAFAAGLVEILSNYPQAVVDRAASPSQGLAGHVAYPNLAKFREKLDVWRDEFFEEQDRLERANRKRLPEPARDLAAEARIKKGLEDLVKHLKSGFSPGSI